MDNTDRTLERIVIATAVMKPSALVMLMDYDDLFYYPEHQELFDAMKELYEAGKDIDLTTLYSHVRQTGREKAWGIYKEIATGITTPFYAAHVNSLVDLSKKRRIEHEAEIIYKDAGSRTATLEGIVDRTEKLLRSMNASKPVNFVSAATIDPDEFAITERAWQTGFSDLDLVIHGFYGGQLIILGARTRIGKSALALQIASHVSRTDYALFFSLEMPVKQISLRKLAMETGIEMWRIRSNKMTNADRDVLYEACNRLRSECEKLTFVDSSYTLQSICNNIRKFHNLYGKCFVVVDYLQLVSIPKANNRYLEIGEVTRTLKLVAMELDIPIMGLSQLNRGSEGEIPKLSDLRESGNLEQDADLVLLMHRIPPQDRCEMAVAKNRDGATKTIPLFFDDKRMSFRCIAENIPAGERSCVTS
jgi:replicative DNA helicase